MLPRAVHIQLANAAGNVRSVAILYDLHHSPIELRLLKAKEHNVRVLGRRSILSAIFFSRKVFSLLVVGRDRILFQMYLGAAGDKYKVNIGTPNWMWLSFSLA